MGYTYAMDFYLAAKEKCNYEVYRERHGRREVIVDEGPHPLTETENMEGSLEEVTPT